MHGLRLFARDRLVTLGVALAASAGCTAFKDDVAAGSSSGGSTSPAASSADGPDAGCDLGKPFGAPTFVPGFTAVQDPEFVRLSPDLLSAYFSFHEDPTSLGYSELYTASRGRSDAPFGAFTSLASLNAAKEFDWWPTVTGDGLSMVFTRSEHDNGPQHLYAAARAGVAEAFSLGGLLANVNSPEPGRDREAFLTPNGRVLYFASDRATPDDYDIYRATADADAGGPVPTFGPAVPVAELNGPSHDGSPTVTPDDLTMYFASDRVVGDGYLHVWMAHRDDATAAFPAPVLVQELLTAAAEWVPTFVSADGCDLYLTNSGGNTPLMVYVAEKPR